MKYHKLGESKLRHKQFLRSQSIQKSIERKERLNDSKVGFFSDIVSYNLKDFVDKCEFNKVNSLRISKANSLEHELKKAEIFTKCIHLGLNVLTEPLLLDRKLGRPDLLVLDSIPMIAYEIINSESSISLSNKEIKYPFKIIEVRLK